MGKILYCASTWSHLDHFHLPHIQRLRNTGNEVHLAARGFPKEMTGPEAYNLPFAKRMVSLDNVRALVALVRLIRRERYQTIHVHTSLAAFLCRLARLLSLDRQVEVIYTCHGYFFSLREDGRFPLRLGPLLYLLCEKLLAGQTTRLLVMNRNDLECAKRFHLCRSVSLVSGMGLDPHRRPALSLEEASRVRVRIGIPEDCVVFVCVGEFSKRKNQRQVIEAYSAIRDQLPDSMLLFAGEGRLLERSKTLVKEKGLENHINFLGYIRQMPDLYALADVVVSASRSEGLPFCIMEALHYRIPIVASNIKGHQDLINHGENGILYPLDNPEALAEAMLCLGRPEKRQELSGGVWLSPRYYLASAEEEYAAKTTSEEPASPITTAAIAQREDQPVH